MQVALKLILHQIRKWATPLVVFEFKHNNNPKAPYNEKQKNIEPSRDR